MRVEQKLIRNSLNGDKRAFGKLVKIYRDQILSLAYDYLDNYDEAKDVAQEVFIKAYENLNSFNQKAEFKTWLYRIGINTSVDFLRKRKSMQSIKSKSEIGFAERANTSHESEIWDDKFIKAMNTLSENQNTALKLKYYHNKSTKEISEIMECDMNTVRIHLHRAIQKLKNIYK